MAGKKIAMVQMPPMSPAVELALLLAEIGNNRAYTVLSHEGKTWVIHFEGDTEFTRLVFKEDKPHVQA